MHTSGGEADEVVKISKHRGRSTAPSGSLHIHGDVTLKKTVAKKKARSFKLHQMKRHEVLTVWHVMVQNKTKKPHQFNITVNKADVTLFCMMLL